MKISRLIEKLTLIELESGDREIVLSSGAEDFEIVAVAPPFLLGGDVTAPVLLELQAIDSRAAEAASHTGPEEVALSVA